MILSISEQLNLFLTSIALGLGISMFYDFFRVLRKIKKYKNRDVYIQDFIFIASITIFAFYVYLHKSNGAIRIYYFIGMILGSSLYFMVFSKLVRDILNRIIILFIKVVKKFLHILFLPLKYVYKVGKPYYNIYKGKTKRNLDRSKKYVRKPKKYVKSKYRNLKRAIKIIFEKV